MRQWDERRRLLGAEDAGDFGGGEDVAFGKGPVDELLERLR